MGLSVASVSSGSDNQKIKAFFLKVMKKETWLKVEVSQHRLATPVVRQRIRVLRIRLT